MRYGVIGEKLGHSFSKEIHTHLADYEYEICEIPREDLKSFFEKLAVGKSWLCREAGG